jgi:hypothetical protein
MGLAPTSRRAERSHRSGLGGAGCRRWDRGARCITGHEAVALWAREMKTRRPGVLDFPD